MKREDVPAGLMSRIRQLKTYLVDWRFSFVPTENEEYEPGIDREEADLDAANIVSSERRDSIFTTLGGEKRHVVAIDIDVPAWLVPSSTVGHHHLYVEVDAAHEDYMAWLEASAKIGLIERGFADVSMARGHSDLRLPWVSKSDQKLHTSDGPTGVNLASVDEVMFS